MAYFQKRTGNIFQPLPEPLRQGFKLCELPFCLNYTARPRPRYSNINHAVMLLYKGDLLQTFNMWQGNGECKLFSDGVICYLLRSQGQEVSEASAYLQHCVFCCTYSSGLMLYCSSTPKKMKLNHWTHVLNLVRINSESCWITKSLSCTDIEFHFTMAVRSPRETENNISCCWMSKN